MNVEMYWDVEWQLFLKKSGFFLLVCKKCTNFAVAKSEKVAWMSGLVTGLQNRAQRFESASDLNCKACQIFFWHALLLAAWWQLKKRWSEISIFLYDAI